MAGGLVLIANWPYTLLVIMPVNRQLLAMPADGTPALPGLLARWNQLHGGRSLLGALATLLMLDGLMQAVAPQN